MEYELGQYGLNEDLQEDRNIELKEVKNKRKQHDDLKSGQTYSLICRFSSFF